MLNRILALSALFTLMLVSVLHAKPVVWSDLSYEESRLEARMAYKPLMAFIYDNDHQATDLMDKKTWEMMNSLCC